MRVSVKFEPRDLWVGVYWNRWCKALCYTDIFICLVPCLPIKITKRRIPAWM